MLTKLKLKDFQSHKDTQFDFDEGLNVITAHSGAGKTATFRALYYLFKNKPTNVKFQRRPDAKSFTIEAELDNHTYIRKKGEKVNEYILDSKKWEDIGTTIPQEVLDTSNIKPIEFNEETTFDVQFSRQFDPHFLLFESGSTKSKFLNRLSGSYIVDLAIKDIHTNINTQTKLKADLEAKKDESIKQRNYYAEIMQPFSTVLDKIKEKYHLIKTSAERLNKLKSIFEDLKYCREKLSFFNKQQAFFKKVNLEGFDFRITRLANLYKLREDCQNTNKSLEFARKTIFDIDRLPLHSLEQKIARYANLIDLRSNYNTYTSQITEINKKLNLFDKEVDNLVKSYEQELEAQKICPTCGREITKSCIDKIKKSLK